MKKLFFSYFQFNSVKEYQAAGAFQEENEELSNVATMDLAASINFALIGQGSEEMKIFWTTDKNPDIVMVDREEKYQVCKAHAKGLFDDGDAKRVCEQKEIMSRFYISNNNFSKTSTKEHAFFCC
jgi:hypothetical protein